MVSYFRHVLKVEMNSDCMNCIIRVSPALNISLPTIHCMLLIVCQLFATYLRAPYCYCDISTCFNAILLNSFYIIREYNINFLKWTLNLVNFFINCNNKWLQIISYPARKIRLSQHRIINPALFPHTEKV